MQIYTSVMTLKSILKKLKNKMETSQSLEETVVYAETMTMVSNALMIAISVMQNNIVLDSSETKMVEQKINEIVLMMSEYDNELESFDQKAIA